MSKVDRNRTKFATIRLTEEECKNIKLYIDDKRIRKSDFIRKCIFEVLKDVA